MFGGLGAFRVMAYESATPKDSIDPDGIVKMLAAIATVARVREIADRSLRSSLERNLGASMTVKSKVSS
jgi:hypothetical protein